MPIYATWKDNTATATPSPPCGSYSGSIHLCGRYPQRNLRLRNLDICHQWVFIVSDNETNKFTATGAGAKIPLVMKSENRKLTEN
jgi:hypothetical protein